MVNLRNNPLRSMPRDLALMSGSLFTWGVGEGMFLYFQSLYLEKLGANPVEIGGILSLMGVAMTLVQAPAGYLADRVGSRPVMWASWVLGTTAAVIMALAQSLPVFVLGMLIYGLTSFVVAPMNSYITSSRGTWSIERALTTVSAIYHLGAVVGPPLGGLIGGFVGFRGIYQISAGIFFISTFIIFLTRRPPTEEMSAAHAATPKLGSNPRFMGLLAIIVVTMFAIYLPQPLTSNYLQNQHGLSLEVIGWLGAAGSLGNALIMLGLGHLSAPAGLLAGQALMAVFALVMWQSKSLPLFFIGYFFVGGYRLARSMALAYARTLVKISETGFAYGLVETGNAISTIAAPLVAGFLYARNPYSMYIASLIAIGLVLLLNITVLPRLRPVQAAEPAGVAQEAIEVLQEGVGKVQKGEV